jgi:hypothetical protein
MINYPTIIKLKWHKGYKKDYPKSLKTYAVVLKNKKKPYNSCTDFALFITEKINSHNFDRWRLLNWSGDVFVETDIESKVHIEEWADLKGKQK